MAETNKQTNKQTNKPQEKAVVGMMYECMMYDVMMSCSSSRSKKYILYIIYYTYYNI